MDNIVPRTHGPTTPGLKTDEVPHGVTNGCYSVPCFSQCVSNSDGTERSSIRS